MASKKLTEKQKGKLRNSDVARINSKDVTINKSYQERVFYDEEDGTLYYDGRIREGKEVKKIINSRNRTSKDSSYCVEDEEFFDERKDWFEDEDDDSSSWRNPDYSSQREWEEDQLSIMFPDGMDDGFSLIDD